jgi:hypothetical protein
MQKLKSRVFVCGDTHGIQSDTKKLSNKNFPEAKSLSKEDVVIQLGDFGWLWYPPEKNDKDQEHWLDWLAERPFTIAVIPGNHENYDLIEGLPVKTKWGNDVRVLVRKGGNIYILERGRVYAINGKKILAVGGAMSTDKHRRIEGIDWWPQELLSKEEENICLDEIDHHNRKVDYICTHTCPARIIPYLNLPPYMGMRIKDSVSRFLDYIDNLVEFKEWHFGHFHVDQRITDGGGDIYQCHYNKPPYELI